MQKETGIESFSFTIEAATLHCCLPPYCLCWDTNTFHRSSTAFPESSKENQTGSERPPLDSSSSSFCGAINASRKTRVHVSKCGWDSKYKNQLPKVDLLPAAKVLTNRWAWWWWCCSNPCHASSIGCSERDCIDYKRTEILPRVVVDTGSWCSLSSSKNQNEKLKTATCCTSWILLVPEYCIHIGTLASLQA